jgi:hypothetical protein
MRGISEFIVVDIAKPTFFGEKWSLKTGHPGQKPQINAMLRIRP